MSVRLFGCGKFRRLSHEQSDRELTSRESRFLDRHREVCPDCCEAEETSSMAMNMLRAAALSPLPAPAFEERVIRKYRVQNVRESITYWSPALAGAGIACLAIFAALALIGRPTQIKRTLGSPDQASRVVYPSRTFPNLELPGTTRFIQ